MLKQFLQGFGYAIKGLKLAWKEEMNFKIEMVCAIFVIAFGLSLNLSLVEFAIIIFVISSVLAAEAFNTALEELCDKFQPTHDPHIEKIKDLSAAAVFITSIGAGIVGFIIFLPHI